jgi:hypothetical protein
MPVSSLRLCMHLLLLFLQVEAQQLVVPNAFGSMLQEAGAVGLNAATSHDNTR